MTVVLERFPLGPQWPTIDPFLFVAHHDDAYPVGDGQLRPAVPLTGRTIGSDFSGRDGWSMYHGSGVPGFPQHPHRGFETVTYVRQGLVDHSDSMGATARYGRGDTQWMTAGRGIQHAEMFPLVDDAGPNPLELFQIWVNLPAADKMVEPYFTMFWDHHTPRVVHKDDDGRAAEVTVIAGRLGDAEPPAPPPNSWAARAESDLAIWHVKLEAGASFTLPEPSGGTPDNPTLRMLYVFEGEGIELAAGTAADRPTDRLSGGEGGLLAPGIAVDLRALDRGNGIGTEALLMQGRPIGEPVARYGPFVMNTEAEINQAFADYRDTEFGGWPWADPAPDHGSDPTRFALHADGHRETAD